MKYENQKEYQDVLLSSLKLSVRTYNCLKRSNIHTLFDLIERYDELPEIRNMGVKSLSEIEDLLNKISTEGIEKARIFAELGIDTGETNSIQNNIPDNAVEFSSDFLLHPVTDLRVPIRVHNALLNSGITTIGQVVKLNHLDMRQLKNMGSLSVKRLEEQINLLRTMGDDYFETEYVDIADISQIDSREIDIDTVNRLKDEYGFKLSLLCKWYNVSRQRIYQKLSRRNNLGKWCGKDLLQDEIQTITEMVNNKQFFLERGGCKFYLFNNMKDDCCFVLVSEEEIKCFFMSDFSDALKDLIVSASLHKLSEEEIKNCPRLGHTVYILKKPYFMPDDTGTLRNLSNARGLSIEEYIDFLYGLPYCNPNTSIIDERIISFLQENTINGKTSIPSTSEAQWIRSYISRTPYTTNEFIEFYGFSVKGNDVEQNELSIEDMEHVEDDMQKYDASKDFIHYTYSRYPLIGSRIISQKNLDTINRNSRLLIQRSLNSAYHLSLQEEMQIALAVINYAKTWDTGDESGFWKYITTQFGFRDDSGTLRTLLAACVKNSLSKNNRWFITNSSGNQFKSSILVHAFSTKRSWLYFCDFLYDFYCNNLNWEYIEGDPMIASMIIALRNRMSNSDEDEDLEISSKVYYFREGIIKLILNRPRYARIIASTIIKRIDALINNTALDPSCYEEQLCDEWMEKKLQRITEARKRSRREEKRTVATEYTRIKPIYQLINENDIQIIFPDVRLARSDFSSLELFIYNSDRLIEHRSLEYYGNELGKTMIGFSVSLEAYLRRSGSKEFNPRIIIKCGNEEVFNSEQVLFRNCLAFKEKTEIDLASCIVGGYSFFIPQGTTIEFSNVDIAPISENVYLKGYYASLMEDFIISLNGEVVAIDNHSEEYSIRVSIPGREKSAEYTFNGVRYSVIKGNETLRIISSSQEAEKRYKLLINSEEVQFQTFPSDEIQGGRIYKIKLEQLGSNEISIRLIDLSHNRLVVRRDYRIIQKLSVHFDKPFYYSEKDYNDAQLKIFTGEGALKTYRFHQGDTNICVPYDAGELDISIPILKIMDDENNKWGGTNLYWIDNIPQQRLLYVSAPSDIGIEILLDDKPVGSDRANVYALGNAVYGYTNTEEKDLLDVDIKVTWKNKIPKKYRIGRIATKEQFVKQPVLKFEKSTLLWDLGHGFIGDNARLLNLTICEGTEFENRYEIHQDKEIIADNIMLPVGEYHYSIKKQTGNIFARKSVTLATGSFFVGDVNELRFLNSIIEINNITFEGENLYSSLKIIPSYIDHITYQGIHFVDSEDRKCPVYKGTMYYRNKRLERREYSFYDDLFDDRGNKLYKVNPVTIVYINDSTLSITNDYGEGLYYYRFYDSNKGRVAYHITDRDADRSNRYNVADLYSYTRRRLS